MQIKNCAAIVSGGGSGMGAATARYLSQAGAKVAVLDTNQEAADKIAKEINGIAIACDVTSAHEIEAAVKIAQSLHGIARICVNCAGIVQSKRMIGKGKDKEGPIPLPLAEFDQVIQVNLVGTFNLMRIVAAAMIMAEPVGSSNERGVIINTASIAAFEVRLDKQLTVLQKVAWWL